MKKESLDHSSRRNERKKRLTPLSTDQRRLFRLARKLALAKRYATHDALTGLLNRQAERKDFPVLEDFMAREGGYLAAIMIDLDFFKKVNDTHGHEAGDSVLVCAAKTFQSCLRQTDKIYRHGGEEFLCLARFKNKKGATALATRLRKTLKETPCLYADEKGEAREIDMTASLGLSLRKWPQQPHASGAGAIILSMAKQADDALYQAKNTGRDKYVLFVEVTEPARPENKPQNAQRLSFCPPENK